MPKATTSSFPCKNLNGATPRPFRRSSRQKQLKEMTIMQRLMKSIGAFALFAFAAAGITQVAAHHSASMFDFTKSQTLKGKVVEMRWVNPHVTITITGSPSPDEAPG